MAGDSQWDSYHQRPRALKASVHCSTLEKVGLHPKQRGGGLKACMESGAKLDSNLQAIKKCY